VTRLTYLDVAIAAGVQASGLSVDKWTARDQHIAEVAAEEAVRAWMRMKPE
jgi:hypothetical protein